MLADRAMRRLLTPGGVIAAYALAMLAVQYHFPGFASPNERSRLYLLEALTSDRTLVIDAPLARHGDMEDKVVFDGHAYSNKPPGLTLLALPVYAAARAADRGGTRHGRQRDGARSRTR